MSILIITSHFNHRIVDELYLSATKVLEENHIEFDRIEVPGVIEIPLTAQQYIKKHKPEVVIALGCVIKGETDHYEWCIKTSCEGLLRVGLDLSTPIVNGILVCRNASQAWDRKKLGSEYAQTALNILKTLKEIV